MALSDGEKLIVAMLADMAIAMGAKHELDPEFISRNLSYNFWAIKRKYAGIFDGNEVDPPAVKWVYDKLTMWSILEGTYEQLSGPDQERVKAALGAFGNAPKFTGFDGHTDYAGIARVLIEELGLYQRFDGREVDSHSPDTDWHERLSAAFRERWARSHDLQADDLIAILNEGIHPEHR